MLDFHWFSTSRSEFILPQTHCFCPGLRRTGTLSPNHLRGVASHNLETSVGVDAVHPQPWLGTVLRAMWGPRSIAKLVNITPITMVYGTCNYSYWGESKPTYNWGASVIVWTEGKHIHKNAVWIRISEIMEKKSPVFQTHIFIFSQGKKTCWNGKRMDNPQESRERLGFGSQKIEPPCHDFGKNASDLDFIPLG